MTKGAKPRYAVSMKMTTIRLPVVMLNYVKDHGGAEYIRGLVEADKKEKTGDGFNIDRDFPEQRSRLHGSPDILSEGIAFPG